MSINMRYCLSLLFVFISIYSCSGQNSKSENFAPQSTVAIQRFDKELYDYLKDPSSENRKILESKYTKFLPAFGRITINNSDSYELEFYTRLQTYFSNQMLSKIYDDALKTFEDLTSYEQEISYANNLVAGEFNGRYLPALYLHVSGFKENVIVLDNVISLSADKYLGSDYPAYKQFFDTYRLIQMQPKFISRDYLKAWLLSEVVIAKKNSNLLDEMIKDGKILYSLSVLLPNWLSSDLITYTLEQETWCTNNEKRIWQTIVQSNHLYSQDNLMISKYINDAPYTSNLSTDSPGRVGAWVGWQIVKAYMSKNNVSLNQMLTVDSQKILKDSRYNP